MRLIFAEQAWEDYLYFQATDPKMVRRINELLKDVCRNHHTGIGKPEPLRFEWSGWWSRRIDQEHRLVYKVAGEDVLIAQCRYHY